MSQLTLFYMTSQLKYINLTLPQYVHVPKLCGASVKVVQNFFGGVYNEYTWNVLSLIHKLKFLVTSFRNNYRFQYILYISFRLIHFSNVVKRLIRSKRRILPYIHPLNASITCADLLIMCKFCTYAKFAPGSYFGHVNTSAYMCNISISREQ